MSLPTDSEFPISITTHPLSGVTMLFGLKIGYAFPEKLLKPLQDSI